VEQLHRVVWVAHRSRMERRGQGRGPRGVDAQHIGNHRSYVGEAQVIQLEACRTALLPIPPVNHSRERMRRVYLAVAVRPDEEQSLNVLHTAEYLVDEAQWGASRPLQIVYHEHYRAATRGHGTQNLRAAALHPYLRGQRITQVRGYPQQRRELRHHRGQEAGVRAQCTQQAPLYVSQLVVRLGQQEPP